MATTQSVSREGVIAGTIGATTVAVWFFFVDLIAGRALFTPTTLGRGLISVLGGAPFSDTTSVIVYTVFHYLAFFAVGILLAWVTHRAETEPHVLVIFMMLFIIFELGFLGITAMLAETGLSRLAWYQVAAGNVLAAVGMGWYLWKAHPALKAEFAKAVEGEG